METRTWLFVALLAAACVSLNLADENSSDGANVGATADTPPPSPIDSTAENTTEASNLRGSDNETASTDTSTPSNTTAQTTTEAVEIVTKKDFDIMGVRMKSYLGRNFFAFCGIPYAEPPVEKRRFKNPVHMTFDGTIDATNCEETPVCMQVRWHKDETEVIGVEDCLFLNVYEPEVTSANMPVIVYIHGGGFFSGSGTFNDVGPHYFMDQDIVLVTINYRLGPLGFFGFDTREAPLNVGMYDQVTALQWVQSYIRYFHGDKHRVTIMGEGAGGASVHLHLFSSQSRNLFQRAISQSGVAFNSWALMNDMVTASRTHATILNCTDHSDSRRLACMRNLDAAKIVNSTAGLRSWLSEPLMIYRPTVQKRYGTDIFLKREIIDLMMEKKFLNVPWLVGTVNTPSFFHLQRYLKDEKLRSSLLGGKFNEFGAKMLDLEASIPNPSQLDVALNLIKAAYADSDGKLDQDALVQMFNDREGNLGLMLAVTYHALLGHNNLYQYRFEYRGTHSMAENITGVKEDEVVNGDDLIYLLRQPKLFPDFDRSTEEGKRDFQMMRKLTAIWAEFAATGEVKALYRNKRATAALSQIPKDSDGAGLLHELSHRRARRQAAEIDNTKSNISNIADLMEVGKDGGNASQEEEKHVRLWEDFVDRDWQNKSSCFDNYASIVWPSVKRFPSTPGNVRVLPYLSFRKGGNDTAVEYCLQYLMDFDRINNWLKLDLQEVRPPDEFMVVSAVPTPAPTTTTARTTTDHPCPVFTHPPEPETDTPGVPAPEAPPPQPPMTPPPAPTTGSPIKNPTAPVPELPLTVEMPTLPVHTTPEEPAEAEEPEEVEEKPEGEGPAPAEQPQYSWPRYPKPAAPEPPRYPQVDFNLPPPTMQQVADARPFPVKPTPPGRPSLPPQFFTWEVTATEVEEEVFTLKPEPAKPQRPRPPRPKPHKKPKSSAPPRSAEVCSYTSLLLLLLLVVQF